MDYLTISSRIFFNSSEKKFSKTTYFDRFMKNLCLFWSKIAIVVSVGWRQSYLIKSEKNALGKNVLSKGTQRKSFTQIVPRSSDQYNFQNVHLLFKHPVVTLDST